MQENEFEKQVKHLMEGFNMEPPAEAWNEINRRLYKKQRRRLPFISLLILGLAVTGGLIFYTKNESSKPVVADKNLVAKDSNNTVKSVGVQEQNETVSPNREAAARDKKIIAEQQHLNDFNGGKTSTSYKPVAGNDNKTLAVRTNTNINTGGKVIAFDNNTNVEINNKSQVSDKPAAAVMDNDYNKPGVSESNTNVSMPVNNTDLIDANKKESADVAEKKTPVQVTRPSKWQFGVNAFYGINNAVESLGEVEKSALDYVGSPSIIITGDTIFNKHAYTSSGAYSFGFEVQRKILNNGVLAAALHFTHLTTKSDVRTQVDSAYSIRPSNNFYVTSYFRPGTSSHYTNKYNFIELPVYFQQNLLQRRQFAFSFNTGFSVRRLIGADALNYNAYNNIYFSKDDQLRKTQLQLLAGLNFSFNTGKTTSIYAGPQFSYSFSNFMKNDDNGNYHFMTYGIKAALLFHKK